MNLDARGTLFLALSTLFCTSLVVGDLIGSKLMGVPLFGSVHILSVGFIPFPITFLLTDLLNEFYGQKAARTVTWVGFGLAWFTLFVLLIAQAAPFASFTLAPDWTGTPPAAWTQVFGGSRRILLASIVAYVVAQFTDIAVFHLLKKKTHNRFLWLRATGSTVASQLIDTVTIQTLAWWGTMSNERLFGLIAASYFGKVLIAILLTPAIYVGHAIVTRGLGIKPASIED